MTYGTFGTDDGFPPPATAALDVSAMRRLDINTIRTYTPPPRWFLDLAAERGLDVLVGLPWEQHIAFLETRESRRAIEATVRQAVAECAGHRAVLGYAVGNEIPSSIVRWHGRRPVERFLERLLRAARYEDPAALLTYANYPSTEYLDPDLVDFLSFNVFLEDAGDFERYLARLHNLAGDRPLVLTELGFDSMRGGESQQAELLERQVRKSFESGCAGTFVFAWTDDWHRGGHDVIDWSFGLVDRGRRPKPAAAAVARAYRGAPFGAREWPSASVVVCTHNGAATLGDCLRGLEALDYPQFEVIVVDDGSTDATAAVAAAFDVRLVRTKNNGLGSARNVGLAEATGDLIAYVDDDARPDLHWLKHLAAAFADGAYAAVGGPNIPPADEPDVACAVAAAPGGPIHVLLSDNVAEHIPGCNMAFRRDALLAIGGFDSQFRVAGDDVDICWQLQRAGHAIGFSPGAVVWHRRRASVGAYLRQQTGYGKAEALLARKWPEKYNRVGHLSWGGRVYGGVRAREGGRRWRVYYGTWGAAPFQSAHEVGEGRLAALVQMPEWYFIVGALGSLVALGAAWQPLLYVAPLLVLAAALVAGRAVAGGRAAFGYVSDRRRRLRLRALTTLLHLAQPAARLNGRVRHGLAPWRRTLSPSAVLPVARARCIRVEQWQPPGARLEALARALLGLGASVRPGDPWDRWDLEVRGGFFAAVRLRLAVEEHGFGKQAIRIRTWSRPSRGGVAVVVLLAGIAAVAGADGAVSAAAILGGWALVLAAWIGADAVITAAAVERAVTAAFVSPVETPPRRDAAELPSDLLRWDGNDRAAFARPKT